MIQKALRKTEKQDRPLLVSGDVDDPVDEAVYQLYREGIITATESPEGKKEERKTVEV